MPIETRTKTSKDTHKGAKTVVRVRDRAREWEVGKILGILGSSTNKFFFFFLFAKMGHKSKKDRTRECKPAERETVERLFAFLLQWQQRQLSNEIY